MRNETARSVVHAGIALLGIVALAFAALDSAIGWIVPITVVGGGLTAAMLLAFGSRRRAAFRPDSFERGRPFDVMNISSVRVAGVGGAGLLVAAAVVALQFQLTTVAVVAGFVGGAIAGVVMIVARHHHGHPVERPHHLY
jgi:ABC-type Fe3+-siderophore transport system permease subunit